MIYSNQFKSSSLLSLSIEVQQALPVVVAVILVLVPPTSPPRKLISAEIGMMMVFSHLSIIIQYEPFLNCSEDIILLVLLAGLCLVL